jgi:hypothetical protein
MEYKLNLSSTENKDLISYCNMNDLRISEVIKKSYLEGFNIERYGLLNVGGTREKQVEKEVIVEKRVEVPIEVIKEVVKIEYVEVEKPVEKVVFKEIIKEIPVEKVVEVIKEIPIERVVEKAVEVIKEIPVERVVIQEVIKEVPVEKVVYVTDQEEMNSKLFQKEQEFEEQRKIFSTKVEEIENIFQDKMSKKDKELDELRHSLDILRQTPPLEKIVEVIKEVPVEVIKEVVIEKESTDIGLKSKLEAIQNTVQKLKQDNIEKDKQIMEYEKTIQEIQKFQQDRKAAFLKGSNLDDTLYK